MIPHILGEEIQSPDLVGFVDPQRPWTGIATPSTELCASVTWSVAPSLLEVASSSTWTVSIVVGMDAIFEKPRGGTVTRYVTANGMQIARIEWAGNPPTCTTSYFLSDHQGSTRKILDANRIEQYAVRYTDPTGEFVWFAFLYLLMVGGSFGYLAYATSGDPEYLLLGIGLAPGIDTAVDAYFAFTDCSRAKDDPTAENAARCGASLGFLGLPLVGGSWFRTGARIADAAPWGRADDFPEGLADFFRRMDIEEGRIGRANLELLHPGSVVSGRGLSNIMDAWLGAERSFGKSNKGFMFASREGMSEFHVRFHGKSHHGLRPHWNIEEYVGGNPKSNIKFYVDWTA